MSVVLNAATRGLKNTCGVAKHTNFFFFLISVESEPKLSHQEKAQLRNPCTKNAVP